MKSHHVSMVTVGSLILAALALPGMTLAQERGRCYKADVHTTMVLPNGLEYGPGQLKICMTSKGVIDGSHRAYVNRMPIGEFRSRLGTGEGRETAFFVFLRSTEDKLVLEGYAVPLRDKLRTYYMRASIGPPRAWLLHEDRVLIAANQ
jgi:hypothetical protein